MLRFHAKQIIHRDAQCSCWKPAYVRKSRDNRVAGRAPKLDTFINNPQPTLRLFVRGFLLFLPSVRHLTRFVEEAGWHPRPHTLSRSTAIPRMGGLPLSIVSHKGPPPIFESPQPVLPFPTLRLAPFSVALHVSVEFLFVASSFVSLASSLPSLASPMIRTIQRPAQRTEDLSPT